MIYEAISTTTLDLLILLLATEMEHSETQRTISLDRVDDGGKSLLRATDIDYRRTIHARK